MNSGVLAVQLLFEFIGGLGGLGVSIIVLVFLRVLGVLRVTAFLDAMAAVKRYPR